MKWGSFIFCSALMLMESSAGAQTAPWFGVISDSFQIDRADQEVIFSINFNRVPDLTTVDSDGRPADQFQLLIDTDQVVIPHPQTLHRVTGREGDAYSFYNGQPTYQDIVGAEITFLSSNSLIQGELRKEDENGEPTSITPYPFTLAGSLASIAIPFSDLGQSPGQFGYVIEIYHFGGSDYSGGAFFNPTLRIPLPEPSLGMLSATAPLLLLRRRRT